MKKKKDAALEYMLKLGIFPAKSPSGALEQLRNVMDPETLKEVLTAEETEGDPQAFYRVKNLSGRRGRGLRAWGCFSCCGGRGFPVWCRFPCGGDRLRLRDRELLYCAALS